MEKVGLLDQTGGGGLTESQLFVKFSKTKFALELSINVMKHTLHKWGGNISSTHTIYWTPQKNYRQAGQKKRKKLGQFPSEGRGSPVLT